MIKSLEAQMFDWKYGRDIIKKFISQLENSDLDKPLPRKKLNTIRKQCIELIQVQACYINAFKTKRIDFVYENVKDTSKDNLIILMEELDKDLIMQLEEFDGTEEIAWFSEVWNIHRHISAMIGHEQMHLGQIIAFCYSCDIKIPECITNLMSLSG